jgi:hypothetical protein
LVGKIELDDGWRRPRDAAEEAHAKESGWSQRSGAEARGRGKGEEKE